MRRLIYLYTVLTVFTLNAEAQKFWLTTYEFPGSSKTAITGVRDTALYVSLTNGILRSFNQGQKWDTVLLCANMYSIHSTSQGNIYAGGKGTIYYSTNYGDSWDSVGLKNEYAITEFVSNKDNHIFAVSNDIDTGLGYVGGGVYFSDDLGKTWQQRNNGIGVYLSCDQIAIGNDGRVFITTRDELSSNAAGLYYSDDNGLLWKHVNIKIDGDGVINDDIRTTNSWGLTIGPNDSIYYSFEGISGNVSVRLNLSQSIYDIQNNTFWNVITIQAGPSWWSDQPMNDIHFAKNGDAYSSVAGTLKIGGTIFRKSGSSIWNKQLQGLGTDVWNMYSIQDFAELSTGKIFMVQYLDERVYWADTSVFASVFKPVSPELHIINVYPNPVLRGGDVSLQIMGNYVRPQRLYLSDIHGKIVSTHTMTADNMDIQAPNEPGTYILWNNSMFKKLICK